MIWLKNNPVGMALAGSGGFLLLLSLLLAWAWSRPVTSTGMFSNTATTTAAMPVQGDNQLGPEENYAVINERPVFEESRTPPLIEASADGLAEDEIMSIAGAPDVRLTGVIITPDQRIVTFTPAGGGEALVIQEGVPLEGEYVGWEVSEINPRGVVLTSLEGDKLTLDLEIHTSVIREPPKQAGKPKPPPASEKSAAMTQSAAPAESGGEQMTRAEEIRERIQQRREDLRRSNSSANSNRAPTKVDKNIESGQMNYQDAINAMMQPRDESGNDKSGGGN
jgi:hypothetical protein